MCPPPIIEFATPLDINGMVNSIRMFDLFFMDSMVIRAVNSKRTGMLTQYNGPGIPGVSKKVSVFDLKYQKN